MGELEELTDLRLDGNALTGMIPSKLQLLSKLNVIRLGGNALSGCVPPALRQVDDHDLDELGLPDCPPPIDLSWPTPRGIVPSGTYRIRSDADYYRGPSYLVFDIPLERIVAVSSQCPMVGEWDEPSFFFDTSSCGWGLHDAEDHDTWVFLDDPLVLDEGRSHYSGCVYDCGAETSPAAFIEQLAASSWGVFIETGERVRWP